MTRQERVAAMIERGDPAELLAAWAWGPCACLGPRDGEPKCKCRMTEKQIGNAVSVAALKRGKLVRLIQR